MENFRVEPIALCDESKRFLFEMHYLKTMPSSIKIAFGLFEENKLIGVCLFGAFSRDQARKKYAKHLELSRLYVVNEAPKNTESFFLGSCLRTLKSMPDIDGVITYADPTEGHKGTIYKASNFSQIGTTSPSYHYENKQGQRVHKRQVWEQAKENGFTELLESKIEGLKKVPELPKSIFSYSFKNRKKKSTPDTASTPVESKKPSKKILLAREIMKNIPYSVRVYPYRTGKFRLCIVFAQKQMHLGYFETRDHAMAFFDSEVKQ